MRIGEYQTLRIARETLHGLYLADSREEVLLPKGVCPPDYLIGNSIRVFVYTDSEDRPVATIKLPFATVGEFAKLRVVSVTDSGAFLDWGLDKDLFCPFKEQQGPMRQGGEYLVRVYLDEVSKRVVCTTKLNRFLIATGEELKPGQPVKVIVSGRGPELISVIIDNRFRGSLFPDEWHEKLEIGDVRDAYIKTIRSEDHKIAVSLRPQGIRAILDERGRFLEALRSNGGSLPVSDKSSPEEIQRRFGMSKGAFKKLIGILYKEGRIVIEENGVREWRNGGLED